MGILGDSLKSNYRDFRRRNTALWRARQTKSKGLVLDPVEFFTLADKRLAYIVNSKCACSSVKHAMMMAAGLDLKNVGDYQQVHDLGHAHNFSKPEVTDFDQHYFFTFVRNPFRRLESLYVNKFLDAATIAVNGFEYQYYLGGYLKPYESFSGFVKKVCEIDDALADRHFKSQCFLIYRESPKIDYIGKMETMAQDYSAVAERFGLPPLPRLNKTHKAAGSVTWDEALIKRVAKRYEEDIERLGYKEAVGQLVQAL